MGMYFAPEPKYTSGCGMVDDNGYYITCERCIYSDKCLNSDVREENFDDFEENA